MSSQHLQNNHGNPQIQKQQRGPQSCYLCFLHTHVKILKKGHTCTFGRNICQPNCKQCHKYYKQRKRDMERKASAEEQNQSANLLGPPIEQQQGQQFIGISIAENNMHCPANFIVSNQNFVPPNFCQYQHAAPPNHTAFPAKKHRIQCQKPIENHNLLFLQSSESEPPPTPQYLLQQHFPAENHSGLQLSESPPSQYIQEHFPFEKRSEEIEENDEAIQFMGIAKREKFDDGGNSNASKRRKIRNEINECFPNEINKCTDNIASAEQKIHLGEANDLIKVLKSAIDLLEKNLASTSASTSILDQNASSVNTNIQQGQKRQQNDGIAQTKINKRNELTSKNANLRPCILLDAVATEGEYDGPMDLSVQRT